MNKRLAFFGEKSDYFFEYKVRRVHEIIKGDNLRILDFGCGLGISEDYFCNYFPNSKIWGIDVSDKSIENARARKLGNCEFSTYDGKRIPFDDNNFDVVFTAGVFHHIKFEEHGRLFGEVLRVLKKGGRFFLFEHNPLNPVTRHMVVKGGYDDDATMLPHNYTRKMLQRAGFSRTNLEFTVFVPGFLRVLRPLEKCLSWLPVGGQYFVCAEK